MQSAFGPLQTVLGQLFYYLGLSQLLLQKKAGPETEKKTMPIFFPCKVSLIDTGMAYPYSTLMISAGSSLAEARKRAWPHMTPSARNIFISTRE